MNSTRLKEILEKIQTTSILVVGDFFLDYYLVIDLKLSETSLETGREAYQVVDTRMSPGAAGNVSANVAALGPKVFALSVLGDDGNGYALRRALEACGVNTSMLTISKSFNTPTYIKPVVIENNGSQQEIERMDIKNRQRMEKALSSRIIEQLYQHIQAFDGVVVIDQVQEEDCGIITEAVREEIINLAHQNSSTVITVDSRTRINRFKQVILKPNASEAVGCFYPLNGKVKTPTMVEECGRKLFQSSGKAVFMTMGAEGILVIDETGPRLVPAFAVNGEIDIVGAGDTTISAITSALCAGANLMEAAFIGNLAASVTIQKIGTTGTASPEEIINQFIRFNATSSSK